MKTSVAAFILALACAGAQANEDHITQGAMRVLPKGDAAKAFDLPLTHTDVRGEISGFLARVKVTQTFTNSSDSAIEAVYVFPLPHDAAVSDLQITIGDRVIKGLIKKRDEARKIYEEAKNAGKTAALLDQERPNIFSQSVANIMPGSEIKVEITYDAVLDYKNGTYEFVFPMVVGPRFIPPTQDSDDAKRITPPVLKPGERNGHDISLSLRLEACVEVRDLESPTHKIEQAGNEIKLSAGDSIPNKDFVLRYRLAGDAPEFGVLSHHGGLGNYFMLMFQPPVSAAPETITPKEMVFVMDCSGSMDGEPIALSKKAVRYALQNLNPDDTFQIIRFSESASPFAKKPLPATPENVRSGLSYINGLSGEGGTMMIEGIKAALDYPHDDKRLRIVCFLTDGYIGNEGEILAAIQQKIGDDTRLFSFGVGSSVNRYLLDAMAEAGRGEVTYVTLNEKPEESVTKFYERVRNPYITHLHVDWSNLDVEELAPSRLRDLFIGQPLFVMGKFGKPASGTITINAKVNGESKSFSVPVKFTSTSNNAALAAMWARQRIKEMSAEQYEREVPAIVEKITDLALKYRLMSQYTSFVAVEDKVVNEGGNVRTIHVPVEMPEGVSYEGVYGGGYDMAMPVSSAPHKAMGLFYRGTPMYAASRPVSAEVVADEAAPEQSKPSSVVELVWTVNGGEKITIESSGEVWLNDSKRHIFVTRLTETQTDKLVSLVRAAVKNQDTTIACDKTGTVAIKFSGAETAAYFVTLKSGGTPSDDWNALLDFLRALAESVR